MKWFFFGCFLLLSNPTWAKLDPDMFGAQGSELLQELKESGVIDQFEKELEKMLHEQKPTEEEKNEETTPQETTDEMVEFINSYVEEKQIKLDPRVLEHLATLKPAKPEDYPKHFVHLGQVLDTIYQLGQMDSTEIDQKTLEVIKRVQSLAVMKTSLNKLLKKEPAATEEVPKKGWIQKEGESLRDPEIAKKNANLKDHPANFALSSDTEGLVPMVSEFIRNVRAKPEFILEVMLPIFSEYGLIGPDVVEMVKLYGKGFVKSENFGIFLESLADGFEAFSKSEGGLRMINMIPQLMEADNKETVMSLFEAEAEKTWKDFADKMSSSDVTEKTLNVVAGGLVSGVNFIQDLMKDDMKMAFANTFLISQGLPAIKPRKLTASLFDLANKCIKTFTTWKFDLEEYKTETLARLSDIEKEYITAASFNKLNQEEQTTLVARFFRDNLVEPFQHLFNARNLVVKTPEGMKCAPSLLCHLNAHMKTTSSGKIKPGVTKMFSLIAAYAWTVEEPETRIKLYQSIWNAYKPETNCEEQYTPTGNTKCHIFPWQSNFMSLNFEHTEL